jgi:hypothetical protein
VTPGEPAGWVVPVPSAMFYLRPAGGNPAVGGSG